MKLFGLVKGCCRLKDRRFTPMFESTLSCMASVFLRFRETSSTLRSAGMGYGGLVFFLPCERWSRFTTVHCSSYTDLVACFLGSVGFRDEACVTTQTRRVSDGVGTFVGYLRAKLMKLGSIHGPFNTKHVTKAVAGTWPIEVYNAYKNVGEGEKAPEGNVSSRQASVFKRCWGLCFRLSKMMFDDAKHTATETFDV